MRIVVSACLLGENCKYNGGNNRNERVLRYVAGHEVITVCAKVAIRSVLSPRRRRCSD